MELVVISALALLVLMAKEVEQEKMEKLSKQDFIKKAAAAAQTLAHETGLPISIIVAQAAHESNFGNSQLAQKSNNLFGIKAGPEWVGPADVYPTWEVVNGKDIKIDAAFRKYSTWEGSVRDWFKFINKPRYAKALAAAYSKDAKNFFIEIQKAGYATDPNYAEKLSGVLASLGTLV